MSLARKLKRREQLSEIRNSYCRKCGYKLVAHKGMVICKKCGAEYGRVSDRI